MAGVRQCCHPLPKLCQSFASRGVTIRGKQMAKLHAARTKERVFAEIALDLLAQSRKKRVWRTGHRIEWQHIHEQGCYFASIAIDCGRATLKWQLLERSCRRAARRSVGKCVAL